MRFLRTLLKLLAGFVALVAGAAAAARRLLPRTEDPSDPVISVVAIWDGADLRSTSHDFKGGAVWAIFGGARVDLRRAEITDDAHLEVTAIFGGVDLTVPDTWLVVTAGPGIAGAVHADVPAPAEVGPEAPRLSISARTLFGGVHLAARPVLRAAES